LISTLLACKGHGANLAVAVDQGGPHVQAETGVVGASNVHDRLERGGQLRMGRQFLEANIISASVSTSVVVVGQDTVGAQGERGEEQRFHQS
jgi:hypothetical protein